MDVIPERLHPQSADSVIIPPDFPRFIDAAYGRGRRPIRKSTAGREIPISANGMILGESLQTGLVFGMDREVRQNFSVPFRKFAVK
jgi:hypothetical protein